MAYTPTVWAKGDVITAEKLNKAEQGISSTNPLVITLSMNGATGGVIEISEELQSAIDAKYTAKDFNIVLCVDDTQFGEGKICYLPALGMGVDYSGNPCIASDFNTVSTNMWVSTSGVDPFIIKENGAWHGSYYQD